MGADVFPRSDELRNEFSKQLKFYPTALLIAVIASLLASRYLALYFTGHLGGIYYLTWLVLWAFFVVASQVASGHAKPASLVMAILTNLGGMIACFVLFFIILLIVSKILALLGFIVVISFDAGERGLLSSAKFFADYLDFFFYGFITSLSVFVCGGTIWIWFRAFANSGFGYGMACVLIPGYVWYYAMFHPTVKDLDGFAWKLWKIAFPIFFILFWYLGFKFLPAR